MTILSTLVEEMIVQLPGITAEAMARAVVGPKCDLVELEQTCRKADGGCEKASHGKASGARCF